MVFVIISIMSIIAQLVAIVISISCLKSIRKVLPWILLSITFLLMLVRRILSLSNFTDLQSGNIIMSIVSLSSSIILVIGIIGLKSFISKQNETEKMLIASETMFHNYFKLPLIGIAIVDNNDKYIRINAKYSDLFEASEKDIIGTSRLDWVYKDDLVVENKYIELIKNRASDTYSMDKRLVNKIGNTVWVSQVIQCIRDLNGNPDYYIIVSEDISKRKELEASLLGTIDEKEALIKELYHRTKNNMQLICSLLQMESDRIENKTIINRFTIIESKIQAMSLVHDRLYSYKNLSLIEFSFYISDVVNIIREIYSDKKVKITSSLDDVVISIDMAIPLGLIVNELITNSYLHAFEKSTEENIINIKLTDNGNNEIELVISDNGVGLKEGFNIKTDIGMGLNTVMALCDQIHSTIQFESDIGLKVLILIHIANLKIRV